NNLGVSRLRVGKYPEAGSEFDRATTLDPGEPDYWINAGIAKLCLKQPAAAVAPLEHARRLDRDDADALQLLIATLESLVRNDEAADLRADAEGNSASTQRPAAPSKGAAKSGAKKAAPGSSDGPSIDIKDPVALARLARVTRQVDLTPETPTNNQGPATRETPAPRPQKNSIGGKPR